MSVSRFVGVSQALIDSVKRQVIINASASQGLLKEHPARLVLGRATNILASAGRKNVKRCQRSRLTD